jgi:PQQ-dependent dehydrogenase (methanol/ethanol family)
VQLIVLLATLLAAASGDPAQLQEDDAQWVMPAKNYRAWRYSRLSEITSANVASLKPAWTFSLGVNKGQEAAPLIIGDTLYVVTPFPNNLYALDLKKNGSAKWVYKPEPAPAAQGVACCDVVNRGAAYANGKIFYNTLDNHVVAVDARTGKAAWTTVVGDINKGESMTMAPLVVKGKVLVGNSGGEFGVRGCLTALDAETGKIAWRAYSTGPDSDVLIGPSFKPFYESDRGKDLGVSTFPPDFWKIGGGTVWGWLSYDAEANLVFYGTGNPGSWNPTLRPGDNKFTTGAFARRPETGEAIWFYQFSPHDLFDHDAVNEFVLVDLEIGGRQRKVALHPGRNGYVYVLDRTTGEVISATPFAPITSSSGVDLKTGRLREVKAKEPQMQRVIRDICPAAPGAKDWQPSAWSPQTQLLYIPHQNLCEDIEGTEVSYIAGTPFVGANVRFYGAAGTSRGSFDAWDPVRQKKAWSIPENFPVWSGALATQGGVVFYGTMEGWFKAVDAKSGKDLWRFKTGSGIIGQPVTYKGPDGKQYVAILSGIGGWPGALVSANLNPADQTAGNGWGAALPDLKQATTAGGMLYVFSLP